MMKQTNFRRTDKALILTAALLWLLPVLPASAAQPEVEVEPAKPIPSTQEAAEAAQEAADTALPALPEAFTRETPVSVEDLLVIEQHLEELINRVAPATVAVRVGGATGSGVVISRDGYILTAGHVSGQPDRDVQVTFPDGTTARGKTLGMNARVDSGLIKITDEGDWPYVQMGQQDDLALGDWVLAIGHPGGFRAQRPVVVRLGRLIRIQPDVLQTDCTLVGGDSGGPLFDMHGRVIGIHSRIGRSTSANLHVPIGTYHLTFDRLTAGEAWGIPTPDQPFLGVSGVDHPEGCVLVVVVRNTPAAEAGLRVGDIVMTYDDRPINGYLSLVEMIQETEPGTEITLKIKRDDAEEEIAVTIGTRGRVR